MKKTFLLLILLVGFLVPQKTSAQAYDPYLGQILAVGFNFAPQGWAMCDGSLRNINQYSALFSLLGTTYGGNGTTTFALPNLNGKTMVGRGQGPGLPEVFRGEQGGVTAVTLTTANIPAHTHGIPAFSGAGTSNNPSNNVMANSQVNDNEYAPTTNTLMTNTGNVGINQPISTMQPYLAVYYIICTSGSYPSQP